MFEKTVYQCPKCHAVIRQEIEDEGEVDCLSCGKRYRVILDKRSGKVGFIEVEVKEAPEPLYLPKGSIRALVTMVVAVACWVLMFQGKDVPGYLFSLLATIIGYYFGFRRKVKTAGSRIFDASAKEEEPLFLPHGFIRFLLIVGFVVGGIVLYARGKFRELPYLEFFFVLFGLILGYLVAKMFSGFEGGALHTLFNHLKGILVLGAAGYLAYLLLSGMYVHSHWLALFLSSVISFYFGSRS